MNNNTAILILNHGEFGQWLVKSAELITGPIEHIYTISLTKEMSLEDLIVSVEERVKRIDGTMIVLTDMFGGTPNNVAMYLQSKYGFPVISGVNLPMLLDLVLSRDNSDKNLEDLVEAAVETGRKSIQSHNIHSEWGKEE